MSTTIKGLNMISRVAVMVVCLVQISVGQYQSSQDAAILSDSRYLSAAGQFGSSYKQEDGIDFKEESDAAGNRRGSYSYIDPNGQRRTISYTAGKDGFRATGDDIPVAPVPIQPVPTISSSYPAPAGVQSANTFNYNIQGNNEDNGQWRNDVDNHIYNNPQPTVQYNQQPAQYNPQPAPYNPQQSAPYNPQPTQYNQQRPNQFQYQQPSAYSAEFNTEAPQHRFYPPGRLNLNRSPDGFSYTFSKS